MKTTLEVGQALVTFCREGKNAQAIETLYSNDIKSVEAFAGGGMSREAQGKEAVMGKTKWWNDNHTVHSATVEGPFPFEDKFAVRFKYEITPKATGKKVTMDEVALYYVQNGKIVREEFFYGT
jgi:hypothetical protein